MLSTNTLQLFNTLRTFGVIESGLHRLSYSPAYLEAQHYLISEMESIGMTTSIDGFGNLIGIYKGSDSSLKPILVGSHLDTVPSGGSYDGALGIVTPLGILKTWHEEGYIPPRSVHLVAFAEEEGITFGEICLGSRYLCGELNDNNLHEFADGAGKTLHSYLKEKVCETPTLVIKESVANRYHSFTELHIEQGPVLESKNLEIGIVRSIVGIIRFQVTIEGIANHAGTTPMSLRQDALCAAAKVITTVHEKALASNGQYVATVGKLSLFPNAANVVPGRTDFIVEYRSEHQELLDHTLPEQIHTLLEKVAAEYHVRINAAKTAQIPSIPMDTTAIHKLEQLSTINSLSYLTMPSGAGHDAMIIGKYIPTVMLFVPSKDGISHNPKEFTSWEAIEKGLLLLEAYLKEEAK